MCSQIVLANGYQIIINLLSSCVIILFIKLCYQFVLSNCVIKLCYQVVTNLRHQIESNGYRIAIKLCYQIVLSNCGIKS